MEKQKVYTAIGLMSGTSLDGVDAALIETDGYGYANPLEFHTIPYSEGLRGTLRACLGKRERSEDCVLAAEHDLTHYHAEAVKALLKKMDRDPSAVDLIGFHGQTLSHDPAQRFTLQIGDGALLAAHTHIPVINDMRSADVAAGGEGAPFLPLYHRARVSASNLETPLVILNVGGVSNVTWIGEGPEDILAFDTGPGNALVDDFILSRTGQRFDRNGGMAKKGQIDDELVEKWMNHPYFMRIPPKSLDRDDWSAVIPDDFLTEDGAATLMHFTVWSIVASLQHMPVRPKEWLVSGGGRHNDFLMESLSRHLDVPVHAVEKTGWNGDTLEAEGFAYLAVRSLLGEPLSLPSTTGVSAPQTGGTLHRVRPKAA